MQTNIKLAAGDDSLESSLFSLAYDQLQGKLKNILPFLVGFQIVKKNEDDTKVVAVFGFKSNQGKVLYVPIFFIDGKIKDINLLYDKSNNQFMPLSEDFAELLLKDDTSDMGSPSAEGRDKIQQGIGQPNLRDVIWPPRIGRISYASVQDITEQNPEVFNKVAELLTQPKDYTTGPNLIEFVKQGDNQIKEAFWGLLSKHANFVDAVRTFYADDQIADSLRVITPEPIQKEAKLKVLDLSEGSKKTNLTEDQKGNIATKGYTVIDNRIDTEKPEVGLFKFREAFSNPVKSGFYPYITEMGLIRYGLIITSVENLAAGYSHPNALVIDLEAERKGQAYISEVNKIFIKDNIAVQDINSALKSLEDPAEALPSYDEYILINENLKATEPFRIIENYKDGSGIRRIKVEPIWYEQAKDRLNSGEKKDPERHITLVLTKRIGDKLEHKNHAVYLPKGYKLLQLHIGDSYYTSIDYDLPKNERAKKEKELKEEQQRVRMGKPGKFCHLASFLRENNTFPLTVHTNGSQYFLNIGGAKIHYDNPLEAKLAMITDVGLTEKDAEMLVTDLIPNRKKEGYIKMSVTGDNILELQDEQPSTNEFGQSVTYGIPWIAQHDRSDGYQKDPTSLGLGVKPDEASVGQTVNQASQLAASGTKDVFDTSAIAALAKYVSPETKIKEYVPSLISAVDKLGRMLFLALFATDAFEKIYGRDDLPELIELLKNCFSNLGDLVIFMRKAMPDLSINSNEQDQMDA